MDDVRRRRRRRHQLLSLRHHRRSEAGGGACSSSSSSSSPDDDGGYYVSRTYRSGDTTTTTTRRRTTTSSTGTTSGSSDCCGGCSRGSSTCPTCRVGITTTRTATARPRISNRQYEEDEDDDDRIRAPLPSSSARRRSSRRETSSSRETAKSRRLRRQFSSSSSSIDVVAAAASEADAETTGGAPLLSRPRRRRISSSPLSSLRRGRTVPGRIFPAGWTLLLLLLLLAAVLHLALRTGTTVAVNAQQPPQIPTTTATTTTSTTTTTATSSRQDDGNHQNRQQQSSPSPPKTVVQEEAAAAAGGGRRDYDDSTRVNNSSTSREQLYRTGNDDAKKQQRRGGQQQQQQRQTSTTTTGATKLQDEREYREFLDWCRQVLGVETILEVRNFEYYDYMGSMVAAAGQLPPPSTTDAGVVVDASSSEPSTIAVRGLAATRDVAEGETVISVPLQALFSVTTTIDTDPVLSRIMGPDARRMLFGGGGNEESATGGAGDGEDDDLTTAVEIPLLAVALLHHKRLGPSSPLSPYLNILEHTPGIDQMPFLWDRQRLESSSGIVNDGVRTVAVGVRKEMKDLYESVVQVLIDANPELLGPKNTDEPESDWMFSYENFKWAFAIVNSRHWQLPVSDLEDSTSNNRYQRMKREPHKQQQHEREDADLVDQDSGLPPAAMPTDAYVRIEKEEEQRDNVDGDGGDDAEAPQQQPMISSSHSFLAPVADMLNFGPPCTRGKYNSDTHSFDIVATCPFRKGQEVTFWYSDECEDVMIGVYGFTHPMISPCPTLDEYKKSSRKWKREAEDLRRQLLDADHDLDYLEEENRRLYEILKQCDCCQHEERYAKLRAAQQQQQQSGGGGSNNNNINTKAPTVSGRLRHQQPQQRPHEHVRGAGSGRGVRKMRRDGTDGSEF